MKISELKDFVQKFCEEREWDQFHNPKDLAVGLSIEAAELLENFRYKSLDEMNALFQDPEKSSEIRQELADVFFFVLRFGQLYNIDLSSALQEKMEINARRYPVEKAKGSNKKYNEF